MDFFFKSFSSKTGVPITHYLNGSGIKDTRGSVIFQRVHALVIVYFRVIVIWEYGLVSYELYMRI